MKLRVDVHFIGLVADSHPISKCSPLNAHEPLFAASDENVDDIRCGMAIFAKDRARAVLIPALARSPQQRRFP